MAISAISKVQGLSTAQVKPSNFAQNLHYWADPDRTRVLRAVHVEGVKTTHYWRAPWAGVIEEIRATQQVAGGGGGNNSCDVQVGPTVGALATVYAAAGDFVNLTGASVAGTSALNFPTAIAGLGTLAACNDGELRTKFNKDDLIYAVSTSGAAALGTVEIEIKIAKEIPVPAV